MAIFPAGKSTFINSPRYLTLRHARRALAISQGQQDPDPNVDDLKPGQEKLNSYWTPALEAGPEYVVSVEQTVGAREKDPNVLELPSTHSFFVQAPQFVLPEGSVHSVYPAPSHSDDHRILPHVVLTDPHLPWERAGSPNTPRTPGERNRTPWLVLLTFSPDELRLSPEALNRTQGIFRETKDLFTAGEDAAKQTSTLSVSLTVSDLLRTKNTASPLRTLASNNEITKNAMAQRSEFVFLRADLFTSLFSTFNDDNERVDSQQPNTTQYQYLSHVRTINTGGMAVAGVEEVGVFSIVVGRRSGPLDNLNSTSVSVHLVSIEQVENMNLPIQEEYVGLCSLYSWNYTVLPPGQLNVADAFTDLGRTLSTLRPPESLISQLSGSKAQVRLANRLRDGFSLVKYRIQTGERTLAMYRGPFTPVIVPTLEMNNISNSGLDLQVLDQGVGVMDLTYSSAWQLGRTLALGDPAFTAALSRFRTSIQRLATKNAKIAVLKEKQSNAIRTLRDVLSDLPRMVEDLADLHTMGTSDEAADESNFEPGGPLKRWSRRRLQPSEYPSLALNEDIIQEKYAYYAEQAALQLALATDGQVYDETNTPVSTDWMVILAWVMNRMFLVGVPAHYLISDPSHLEEERLKFFYIDPNWIDAMIDGALSLANHRDIDVERVAIKKALNRYIKNPHQAQQHTPQIPTHGFYLRSDVVSRFPDLKVTTYPEQSEPAVRAPLLRHEIVTDGVMLGLFDRQPGSAGFTGLAFTQPPHQQRFAAADAVDANRLAVTILAQYTVDEEIRKTSPLRGKSLPIPAHDIPSKPTDKNNLFIWGSAPGTTDLHMLRLPRFAEFQVQSLLEYMGTAPSGAPYFNDNAATSALFAMQLNDPVYSLHIGLDNPEVIASLGSLAPPPRDGRPSSPPLRVLTSLNLVEVKTPMSEPQLPSDDDSDGLSDPDHDALAAATIFRRGGSSGKTKITGSNIGAMAPHIRPIPIDIVTSQSRILTTPPPSSKGSKSSTSPKASSGSKSSPKPKTPPSSKSTKSTASPSSSSKKPTAAPATAPIFDVKVYTNTANARPRVVYSSEAGLPQDLVLSVIVSRVDSNYGIEEFDICFPLGAPSTGNIFSAYDGPGPFMMSNLRFNALPAYERGGAELWIRLLPRSVTGSTSVRLLPRSSEWTPKNDFRDMSVMLSMAKVNVFRDTKVAVPFYTRVKYRGEAKAVVSPQLYMRVENEALK